MLRREEKAYTKGKTRGARWYPGAPEPREGQPRELLGIKSYSRPVFRNVIDEAERRIGGRDADDVELLALALALKIVLIYIVIGNLCGQVLGGYGYGRQEVG